jgi:hypothetical protein
MKPKLSLFLGGLFLFGQSAMAQTNYTVSATLPAATGVSIAAASVDSTSGDSTQLPGGTSVLSFSNMTYNAANGIYVPNLNYSLNFSVSGGSGTPDVTVTYNEGSNPNGVSNGLGYKATATFAKEVVGAGGATTESLLAAHGPKKRLIDLNGEHVSYTELTGGYLRIYVGVWTGTTTGPAPDPSNGQPFSSADASGTYSGSFVVTTVVN